MRRQECAVLTAGIDARGRGTGAGHSRYEVGWIRDGGRGGRRDLSPAPAGQPDRGRKCSVPALRPPGGRHGAYGWARAWNTGGRALARRGFQRHPPRGALCRPRVGAGIDVRPGLRGARMARQYAFAPARRGRAGRPATRAAGRPGRKLRDLPGRRRQHDTDVERRGRAHSRLAQGPDRRPAFVDLPGRTFRPNAGDGAAGTGAQGRAVYRRGNGAPTVRSSLRRSRLPRSSTRTVRAWDSPRSSPTTLRARPRSSRYSGGKSIFARSSPPCPTR